jgi:hypothetical protein
VGATPDADFGPRTEARVITFQRTAGLTPDGIVGKNTWRAIAEHELGTTQPVIVPPDSDDAVVDFWNDIAFVQAKNFTYANRMAADIDWIVIHDMEAAEHPGTAENVASWFAGRAAPQASAHYNIDNDSIVQSVRDKDVAWHAKKGNRRGIGIEHAGYYHQTREEWLDEYSAAMLELSAQLCARLCLKHQIPPVFVDEDGLRRGDKGFTYHGTITRAFKVSGGHLDPGKNFPIHFYLGRVREIVDELDPPN